MLSAGIIDCGRWSVKRLSFPLASPRGSVGTIKMVVGLLALGFYFCKTHFCALLYFILAFNALYLESCGDKRIIL